MQRETIRSALIDLLNSGDLEVVEGRLHFRGEPLADSDSSDYRGDGWSVETSYGCRRHRAIDEFLETLSSGDEFERRVANEADQWFCFSQEHSPELAPEDEVERDQASKAYYNSNLLIRLLGGVNRRDNSMDYRLAAQNWDGIESDQHWFMPPGHAVVYGVHPEDEAPSRWPEEYIAELKSLVQVARDERGGTP